MPDFEQKQTKLGERVEGRRQVGLRNLLLVMFLPCRMFTCMALHSEFDSQSKFSAWNFLALVG